MKYITCYVVGLLKILMIFAKPKQIILLAQHHLVDRSVFHLPILLLRVKYQNGME